MERACLGEERGEATDVQRAHRSGGSVNVGSFHSSTPPCLSTHCVLRGHVFGNNFSNSHQVIPECLRALHPERWSMEGGTRLQTANVFCFLMGISLHSIHNSVISSEVREGSIYPLTNMLDPICAKEF